MQTLTTLHTLNVAAAGASFDWAGYKGACARPQGGQAALLRYLTSVQGGVCAACGDDLNDGTALEVCHLVSGGAKRRGYVPGNLYAGHKSCNDDDRECFGAIVPPESLARPDVVLTTRPTTADLEPFATTTTTATLAARRAARMARMGR